MTLLEAPPTTLSRADAVRFLQRASFGGTPAEVDRLMAIGIDAWMDEQFEMRPRRTFHQRMMDDKRIDEATWQAFLSDPDQLRKRVGYAWSQIMVASLGGVRDRELAVYVDVLEANCLGTYRELLERVTRTVAMANYLTYERNRRADESRGTVPDENYAREVMQLFSIGLWELNQDGTRRLDGNGEPMPTYGTEDIIGLARVFTGFETPQIDGDLDRYNLPLVSDGDFANEWHERGEKQFLGVTIPASDSRTLDESLAIALDTLADHPNVGPFISRQLIQRLVTSNPSTSYVGRVAGVFNDDGTGTRGNLGAVTRAILVDDEAWLVDPPEASGKVREPVLRFTIAMRAFDVGVTRDEWFLRSLNDPATQLGQTPFQSRSVFNFYRPGYVPPLSPLGDSGLQSPEMQIANETTAIAWVNFIGRFLRQPFGVVRNRGDADEYTVVFEFEYDDLIALIASNEISADQAGNLVDELAARLCPQGLSSALREVIIRWVREITDSRYDRDGDAGVNIREDVHLDRVTGAATMILASTDFIWER